MSEEKGSGLRIILIFIFLFCIANVRSAGQNVERQLENARRYMNSGNLAEAEKIASGLLRKDSSLVQVYYFLADLYHQTDSVYLESRVLKALTKHSEQTTPLFYYRIGKATYLTGNYTEAKPWLEKYLAQGQGGLNRREEVIKMVRNCGFAIEAMKHPVIFEPHRLSNEVNSADDEYWPVLSVDGKKLVFTRLVKNASYSRLPQEDFYQATGDSSGWHNVTPISEVNTPGNEGAQSLSADGSWLYFTACNRSDGKGSCDIYFSRFSANKWSSPLPVKGEINTSGWEGQPSISADGRMLYFSSDRPGGKGGKDIWYSLASAMDQDGIPLWDKLRNPGDSINTPGDEISPFIHADGINLYFASDYWPGMGGFDLFHATLKGYLSWSAPVNLGYPVNTLKNEQGFVINAAGNLSFFSSGRGQKTGMDIYSFETDKKYQPTPVTYLKANVVDAVSGKPVRAEVRLEKLSSGISSVFKTDSEGNIFTCLPIGSDYSFMVSKEGYLFYSANFPLSEKRSIVEPYLLEISLNPVSVGEQMNLYNIFFDVNSAELLPGSFPELEKLYELLVANKKLVVEIQGHTDSTGSKELNRALSGKRAVSVMNYLTGKGISGSRMSARGFGPDVPVADNATEEGRRKNRRTTILIRSID